MELVKPDKKYLPSFLEAVKEWDPMRNQFYLDLTESEQADGESYVQKLLDEELGKGLPVGWVPATRLWMVEGDRFYGTLSIRHELTEDLRKVGGHIGYDIKPSERGKGYGTLQLKLGLEKAKQMGINEVLITCDAGNTASRKIIEANGGKLEKEAAKSDDPEPKLRYWINI
jgi:predicted acetyltransferase